MTDITKKETKQAALGWTESPRVSRGHQHPALPCFSDGGNFAPASESMGNFRISGYGMWVALVAEKKVGKWIAEQEKRTGTKEYKEGHSGL